MIALRFCFIAIGITLGFGSFSAKAVDGNVSDLVNRKVLRVCSDPANIPFSNNKAEGFENQIADIIADELKIPVAYTWFPQATGFVRRTLFAKRCDLIIGFAQGDEFVLNTNHYYVSTYVLVYRKDNADLKGLDTLSDDRLKGKRIGLIAGTPPGNIIAREGLMGEAKPYRLTVDRRFESPNERMIEDIRSGEIDVGIMWGPIGGYFAKKGGDDLVVVPLLKEGRSPRMTYRITMGVRQTDKAWKRQVNEVIKKRQKDIDAVLLKFGVPLVDEKNKLITEPRG